MITQQQYCSPHPGYLPSHITNSQFNSEVPSTNKNALLNQKGAAQVNIDQKQASGVQSPSLHNRNEFDDEGPVNKQILVSIGSMAKLKHPKRYWPKFSNQRSATTLIAADTDAKSAMSESTRVANHRLKISKSATFGFL